MKNIRIKSLLFLMFIIIGFSGCSNKNKTRYSAQFLELFNTATTIIGYADTKEEFSTYSQLIYDNLKEYHELYDIYNNYEGINNLKTVNDNAGIQPVKVDKRIIELLLFSKEAYEISQEETNVALGPVLRVWHDYRTIGIDNPEEAKLPPYDLLETMFKYTAINKVIIDEEASTVFLEEKEMSLDVGGIAKGYATEMVSLMIQEKGLTSGIISVGGNVRTIGSRYEKEKEWTVGVQNPDLNSEEPYVKLLKLEDMSLVTSGVYQRYYTVDGERYHHIIDKDTLMPASYFTSVSVVCKDSGMADAITTAIFNMPYEDGYELIESIPETEALWIFPDGEIKYSSNFKSYVKE